MSHRRARRIRRALNASRRYYMHAPPRRKWAWANNADTIRIYHDPVMGWFNRRCRSVFGDVMVGAR
jgi:hypothetical protein